MAKAPGKRKQSAERSKKQAKAPAKQKLSISVPPPFTRLSNTLRRSLRSALPKLLAVPSPITGSNSPECGIGRLAMTRIASCAPALGIMAPPARPAPSSSAARREYCVMDSF
ncbi:MAG: hypothetical protein ACR2K5_09235 [Pseudolabrys sp.]